MQKQQQVFFELKQSEQPLFSNIPSKAKSLDKNAQDKQRLIDNLAHELRTPLTAIRGYAEYLQSAKTTEPNRIKAADYIISVNSVTGSMLDASVYDLTYTEDNSQNVQDPTWKATDEADIAKLIPKNVSITGSKVVAATPLISVMVVSELSDGSACAVRLSGANKEAAAYQYFPNGYDGSWDYHPVTGNGVG